MCFSPRFEAELIGEQMGRFLSCAYSVEPIAWFTGEMQIGSNKLLLTLDVTHRLR